MIVSAYESNIDWTAKTCCSALMFVLLITHLAQSYVKMYNECRVLEKTEKPMKTYYKNYVYGAGFLDRWVLNAA